MEGNAVAGQKTRDEEPEGGVVGSFSFSYNLILILNHKPNPALRRRDQVGRSRQENEAMAKPAWPEDQVKQGKRSPGAMKVWAIGQCSRAGLVLL